MSTKVEWAVDMGFGVWSANSEAEALSLVKSYEDYPEALEGDPMPYVIMRTVTTTEWEPLDRAGTV